MHQETAEEMLTVMRDVRALLGIQLREEIDQISRDAFQEDEARKEAFKLLGQGKSYREIADEVDSSHATVGRWVREWRNLGLVHAGENSPVLSSEALGL